MKPWSRDSTFYTQTLLPSSPSFELANRTWEYPLGEFQKAFTFPHWPFGYGIGTCSVGTQYVTRILGAPAMYIGVESGYGNLLLEMGVPGVLLWLIWTGVLLAEAWKVVRQLRGTPLFPMGFAIFCFAFITLLPEMAAGIPIENFVNSAFLWLLLGILFRLPALSTTHLASERASGLPAKGPQALRCCPGQSANRFP